MEGVLRSVSIFLEATPVLVVLVKSSAKTGKIVQLLVSVLYLIACQCECGRTLYSRHLAIGTRRDGPDYEGVLISGVEDVL